MVYELIVYRNVIVIDLILAVQLNMEFRCNGNIEYECIGCIFLKVLRLLLFRGQRLAKHLDFIILYVLVNLLSDEFIDGIHLYRSTELALDESHGNLPGAETRHVCFLAIILQCLLDILFVIGFFDGNGHQTIHFVGVFK